MESDWFRSYLLVSVPDVETDFRSLSWKLRSSAGHESVRYKDISGDDIHRLQSEHERSYPAHHS